MLSSPGDNSETGAVGSRDRSDLEERQSDTEEQDANPPILPWKNQIRRDLKLSRQRDT
jgi:hypothetical protein